MSSELPTFSIKQLLEAGVHFGHKTMRRNPKMGKYIYGSRNGVSIIDLNKTANLLYNSLKTVKEIAKNNGRILFVATKKQAIEPIAEAAKRCGQYYVNFRWLGGMLTNWKTVSQSIKTLRKIEEQLSDTEVGYNKKEKLVLERERKKLEHGLGGIKNMGGYPDLVFVIDTNKEAIAIAEAKKLNIPIMAILDTNCNPDGIAYPIPGNDDSAKSIKLFCRLISDAAISGTKEHMTASGIDLSRFSDDELPAKIAEIKHAALEKTEKKDKKPKEHVKEEQEQHKHEPREIMHKEHKEEPKEIEAVHHEKSDKKHHDKKEIVKKVEVVTKKASVKKAAEKSEKKPVVKKVTIKKPAEKKKPAAKKKK